MKRSVVVGPTLVLLASSWALLWAQPRPQWPMGPRERGIVAAGLPVTPLFEGWYENPDGTYTFSFGYFNRNTEEVLTIPVGPNNFIEPAEYNGVQPTIFEPGRDTGVFAVTVPGDFARNHGRVVWTLNSHDVKPHSVPGKIGVEAYRLYYGPMAMGSFSPVLKLRPDGPELWGAMTIAGDARTASAWSQGRTEGSVRNPLPLTASLGTPLTLTVWVADRLAPDAERERVGGGATWFTHQGPAPAVFSEPKPEPNDQAGGEATTTVTFTERGEYLLRVRADNFNPVDSTPGDQCCWTNGYLKVTVSP